MTCGDLGRAEEIGLRACLELEAIGDAWGLANALGHLGIGQISSGSLDSAVESLQRCLDLTRDFGDPEMAEYALLGLGIAQLELSELDEAAGHLRTSLKEGVELGDKAGVAGTLFFLAAVAAAQDEREHAARLLGVASALQEELRYSVSQLDRELLDPHLGKVGLAVDGMAPSHRGDASLSEFAAYALDGA
jgi:tetratricopeptide (TPR) repeat protein